MAIEFLYFVGVVCCAFVSIAFSQRSVGSCDGDTAIGFCSFNSAFGLKPLGSQRLASCETADEYSRQCGVYLT